MKTATATASCGMSRNRPRHIANGPRHALRLSQADAGARLVEESGERPDPSLGPGSGAERRRHYRITPLGARAVRAGDAAAWRTRWRQPNPRGFWREARHESRSGVLPDLSTFCCYVYPQRVPRALRRGDEAGFSRSLPRGGPGFGQTAGYTPGQRISTTGSGYVSDSGRWVGLAAK